MADTDQIQVASDSKIGFGVQTGKGVYTVANKDFRYFPFTSSPYGIVQPVANLPQEGGGDLTPKGSYKSGSWGQGGVQFIPRFVDDLGFVLASVMGQDYYATATPGPANGENSAFGRSTEDYTPAAATITFTAGHILDSASGLGVYKVGDIIKVSNSVSNNATPFTVTTAAAGDLTVTGNTVVEATPVKATIALMSSIDATATGSQIHTFAFKAKQSDVPYVTVRKLLEGPTPLGEETVDNRFGQMELTLPNVGPMTCALELNGRTPANRNMFYADPFNSVGSDPNNVGRSAWYDAANNGYDDDTAFGLSVDPNSVVKIAGGKIQCTGAVITTANNLQQADAGRIIGDITPLDFPVLSRVMSIRAQMFMTDDYIYRQLFTGSLTGRKFSSKIYAGDIDFRAYSAVGITSASIATQYALQVLTNDVNVQWALQGAVDPKPGQPLTMTLVGTVQRPATAGKKYAMVRLQNAIASAYPYVA
jgi:hypothetical protein